MNVRLQVLLLPFLVFFIAAMAVAQNSATLASDVQPQDVIVPWRHFGAQPEQSSDPPAPQAAAAADPAPAQQPEADDSPRPDPPSPQMEPLSAPSAQAPSSPTSGNQATSLYEADISKKHPHPPEPVALPLADQSAAPLTEAVLQTPPGSAPPASASRAAPAVADNSPEGRIAATNAAYQQRQADRELQAAQIESAAGSDPAARWRASIGETKLKLEGARDRAQTADQLSKAFADLAQELSDRASQMRSLADARRQTEVSAEAGLSQLNNIAPRLKLARHNLALLPSSDAVAQEIRTLDAEIAQDREAGAQSQERRAEAATEDKALESDAAQLDQAAAQARRKSSSLVEAAQNAQAEQRVLADRLQFFMARQRAADLLASSSKALQSPMSLAGDALPPEAAGAASAATRPDCSATSGGCSPKGEQ